jgi:hypothetical protein
VSLAPSGKANSNSQFLLTQTPSITVTGLTAAQKYIVAVAAVNEHGAKEATTTFTTQ